MAGYNYGIGVLNSDRRAALVDVAGPCLARIRQDADGSVAALSSIPVRATL